MTLEEAIKHAEEVAEENEKAFVTFSNPRYSNYGKAEECKDCAEEHRQLAEWLKDYKRLLDNRLQQNEDTTKTLEQEPKFVIKSDGTIEQIKNCNDCLLRKEWEKIGKFLSVVLEKQTNQEPKAGHWKTKSFHELFCDNCGFDFDIMRNDFIDKMNYCPNCGCRMVEPQESEDK